MGSFYAEIAREKLGMGEDWQVSELRDMDWKKPWGPNSRTKITGYCCPRLENGRIAWAYADRSTKKSCIITVAEHQAWIRAWELRTGQCHVCIGTPGVQKTGWDHLKGELTQECPRCKGNPGVAPEVEHG